MKIVCETNVVNRLTSSNLMRAAKATLAIGLHPPGGKKDSELFIIHFTPQNKVGCRYKIKENVEKVFPKFIDVGKVTISFKSPQHDLQIKCDPNQLKAFMQMLRLGLEGKTEMGKLGLGNLATTAVSVKSLPVTKLVIARRGEYPVQGFPKTLKNLTITGIKRTKVDEQIMSLQNLTILHLHENCITNVPKDLGNLQLVDVNLSSNKLGEVNCWSWLENKIVQKSLKTLNLSDNKIGLFPYSIVKCTNLNTLKLDKNEIWCLPFAIRRMKKLRNFYISANKLESLPLSITELKLDVFNVSDNTFDYKGLYSDTPDFEIIVPPLWELASRVVTRKKIPYNSRTLPCILIDILSESPLCICGRLCFSSEVFERAALLYFPNVREIIQNEDRCIYADCVFCSKRCARRIIR